MKYQTLLIVILLLFSNINQAQKREHKTFENEDFTFNYPKKWQTYNDQQRDIVVSVAPKLEIQAPVYISGIQVSNREFSKYKFCVYIEKYEFNSLEEYVEYRKNKRKEQADEMSIIVEYKEKIISETRFQELIIFRNRDPKNREILETVNLLEYYVRGSLLYVLYYMAPINSAQKYNEEANQIFDSFTFKNP